MVGELALGQSEEALGAGLLSGRVRPAGGGFVRLAAASAGWSPARTGPPSLKASTQGPCPKVSCHSSNSPATRSVAYTVSCTAGLTITVIPAPSTCTAATAAAHTCAIDTGSPSDCWPTWAQIRTTRSALPARRLTASPSVPATSTAINGGLHRVVVQAVDKRTSVPHPRAGGAATPLPRRRDRWLRPCRDRIDGAAHGSLHVLDVQQRRRGPEQPLASA